MADFNKMAAHVAQADKEVALAMECFHPTAKITLTDSYILGHLRACQAVLDSMHRHIREHQLKLKPKEAIQD